MKAFLVILVLILLQPLAVLAAVPQRIVSGMPAITEMLYALGLEDRIVGVTTNCNYPPYAKNKPQVGGFFLNLEKVVSLQPDLIVMQEDAQPKDIQRFKKYGLNVQTINPQSIDGVMNALRELGELTGRAKEARQVTAEMKRQLEKVARRTGAYRPSLAEVLSLWQPKKSQRQALVIVGLNPLIVAGGGTFVDDIIRKAGVANVAAQAKGAYPQFSFEKLVKENPQYLIIPRGLITEKQLAGDQRWQSLEAVKAGRILFLDQDILFRPGPRVVVAVAQIADFIYP